MDGGSNLSGSKNRTPTLPHGEIDREIDRAMREREWSFDRNPLEVRFGVRSVVKCAFRKIWIV